MKVQINDVENSQKELVFELPYETFEKVSDEELVKIIPTVKVPGFRPGKAPRDIIKKQYTHKIRANAIERVINDAIRDALTQNNIMPLAQANVTDVEFDEGKPIKFKARVDVFPKVDISKYSGFDFERVEVSITEKDMDESLKMLQERHVSYVPVTKRDKVQKGDVVSIDFEGKIDGVAFQGGAAKNHSLEIGSGQFIPGFEDGVVGMKKGETKDITVTFPKEYNAKDLAGKDSVFTVTVHEIKERVLPEIDDRFAKQVDPTATSMKDLEAKLKKGLAEDLNNKTKFETFSEMLDKIVSENPFEVPLSFAKEQAERLAYNNMNQFYQMGLDPEKVGISFDMLVERNIPQAKSQVKQALVINEIAKKEKIVVEDADVDKFLAYHAEIQNRSVEDVKKELQDQNLLEGIKNDVLGEKVREFLEGINSVKIKKMTKEEYEKSLEAKNAAAKKAPKAQKEKSDKEDLSEAKAEKKEKAPAKAKKKKDEEA